MDEPTDPFDEDCADEVCLRALEDGLPDPPEVIIKGQCVPVARWAGPLFGAVLRVEWFWNPERPEDDRLDSIVQPFRRTAAGWDQSGGDGGSGRFEPPFQRPSIEPEAVSLWGTHVSGDQEWMCAAPYGVVGSGISTAELHSGDQVISRPIESKVGALVLAFDATLPADLKMISLDGAVIRSFKYDPKVFRLIDA